MTWRATLSLARMLYCVFKYESETDSNSYKSDRKSTRLNSSHGYISYAVFCLKKQKDRSFTKDSNHPGRQPGTAFPMERSLGATPRARRSPAHAPDRARGSPHFLPPDAWAPRA